MKQRLRLAFVLILGVLVACQTDTSESPTPTPPPAQTDPTPTQPPATQEEPTEIPETPTPEAETAVSPVSPPTLFDVNWGDREIFRPGLIDGEQGVLEQLPGATVYHLDLQIEDSFTTVRGRQEVYYTNQETVPLGEVYFHLFPNLLGDSITVSNVLVNEETVRPTYESFNDSEMQIPLPSPLQPGDHVVIQMGFTTAVPTESGRNYGVFAYLDNVLALAHFYPMVAVYDDTGWNIEEPAESGDVTYADTSLYLVRATIPANRVVVASGIEIGREEEGGRQTITFAAGPMRDFYLAASDDYVVASQKIGQTQINSYAPADLVDGAETVLASAVGAMQSYSDRFGAYPFTELDIVSTPTLALGVEYPGMIANTVRMYDLEEAPFGIPNNIMLESVTAHEVGHQWFYSVIGNDQLDEPWLDESLAQYVTWLYYIDAHGESGAQGLYQSFEGRWSRVEFAETPIGLPVSAYEGAEYSAIVYGRGPIFFNELAQTIGQETMDAFLRDYYLTYQWGIATTEDLRQLAEQHCDCDLTPLFEKWVYDN